MGECPAECATWAMELMGYCLCSTKDGVSLGLGLVSVVSWSVAEIPQIVTNFKTKSTEGLSLLFLFTWIIGDFFNLFGCLLEPATLPTQFYMALLYTITTLTLTLQSVYYGHIYPRLRPDVPFDKNGNPDQIVAEGNYDLEDNYSGDKIINISHGDKQKSIVPQNGTITSSPISVPHLPRSHSADQDSYYMSARFLSTGHTPTKSSFLARRKPPLEDVEDSVQAPLLGGSLPNTIVLPTRTKNLLCVVSAVSFILGISNITSPKATRQGLILELPTKGVRGPQIRKLLQVTAQQKIISDGGWHAVIGTYLGWAMAALYMGGRLPQICLNIRRGNVEGLNPFMFMFALLGNTTYVASILVNSLDWSKIMPNMPWLVDAGGCALLDTFILLQFMYFQYWQSKRLRSSSQL